MNPITPRETPSETEATARLRELLGQRVAVLDGAWGTMLQGAGLTPADYRGDRFGEHTHDVTGDPDLLNLTRPDVILDVHRQYLAAGADITTTNTFTATGIGQADYGLQAYVHEMNVRGAQLARQAADEAGGRFVAGLDRPAERHALPVAQGRRPGVPCGDVRPGQGRVRRADRRARRGRRRPAADRDDLRHAQLQGRDRRRPRGRAAPAAVDLGDDRRPQRPDAVGPDRRGVLELDRAREAAGRRRELLARRGGDAPARRGAVPARRHVRRLSPERRPARTPSAATTRRPTRPPAWSAGSPATAWSTSSAAAAARPRRTSRRSPPRRRASRPARCPRRAATRGSAGSSRSASAPTPGS